MIKLEPLLGACPGYVPEPGWEIALRLRERAILSDRVTRVRAQQTRGKRSADEAKGTARERAQQPPGCQLAWSVKPSSRERRPAASITSGTISASSRSSVIRKTGPDAESAATT